MIPKAFLKKIKTLEIKTRRIVNTTLSGEYHSIFKGRGISFAEVREYAMGDESRLIDWNISAKMGKPYIKLFEEERELQVILMIDISQSKEFGSGAQTKDEIATEIAAVLGFSAVKNRDKVGLLLFTNEVEQYVPPKKGKNHMFRILRDIYCYQAQNKGTSIQTALKYIRKVVKKKAIIFLISDFMDQDYDEALRIVSRTHEIVPIVLEDPKEISLPKSGLINVEDSETGEIVTINTYSKDVRQRFKNMILGRQVERNRNFKTAGLDPIQISIGKSYIEQLNRYFKKRIRQKQ